jgi:hypothetical protein
MSSRSRKLSPLAAAQLTLDAEPYLSCDDCFEQVDARVEALFSTAAVPLTPEFRAHLIGCAACRDEAWSLAELAAQDIGVDRETVRARFEGALTSDKELDS